VYEIQPDGAPHPDAVYCELVNGQGAIPGVIPGGIPGEIPGEIRGEISIGEIL